MIEVARNELNTINSRVVPIFFLPGVMGTRLTLGKRSWDPDNEKGMAWDWVATTPERQRVAMGVGQQGVVMTAPSPAHQIDENSRDHGWEGLAWRSYGGFLPWMNSRNFGSVHCPVFAIGYDWRLNVTDCAAAVAAEIKRRLATAEVDAEQYIIITHSMGGLVGRTLLKNNSELAEKLLGVIHVVQPAVGAPVLYRRFFTGTRSGIDGDWGFTKILGNTPEKFATVMSGLIGPMQLLPSNLFRDTDKKPWLTSSPFEDRRIENDVGAGAVTTAYRNGQIPPGIIDRAYPEVVRNDLLIRIGDAGGFFNALGDYKHPNTWAVYGTEVETDMAVHFDLAPTADVYDRARKAAGDKAPPVVTADRGKVFLTEEVMNPADRGWQQRRRAEGDGTVPMTSASALFPDQHALASAYNPDSLDRQFSVPGCQHEPAFNHPDVRAVVENIVRKLLGG